MPGTSCSDHILSCENHPNVHSFPATDLIQEDDSQDDAVDGRRLAEDDTVEFKAVRQQVVRNGRQPTPFHFRGVAGQAASSYAQVGIEQEPTPRPHLPDQVLGLDARSLNSRTDQGGARDPDTPCRAHDAQAQGKCHAILAPAIW